MTAKLILEMIENVSIDDTNRLGEIDARVWCWLNGFDFDKWFYKPYGKSYWQRDNFGFEQAKKKAKVRYRGEYTRSRDALKRIRPKGWVLLSTATHNGEFGKDTKYYCTLENKYFETDFECVATEELAELHAIIQAKEWENNNDSN